MTLDRIENYGCTVLITGCAGLLGSRLADFIIENRPDIKVVGIDDLSGGYEENVHESVEFSKINLTSPYLTQGVFERHRPDYVFHFAAYAAECLSPFIRNYNYQNNTVATANIVNNCINYDVKRLVFTSTMAVYGDQTAPFSEDMDRKPIDPYGIAKSACEADIEVAGEQHGLDWCIIRPHNVYGAKQNIWDRYRNVLGIWMNNYMQGKPITIYGDGNQERAFSCIDDCLWPMFYACMRMEASKQIINLGGIEKTSINEAADTIIKVMGGGEKVYYEPRHEVKLAWSTHKKSEDLLWFEHETSLEDGLKKMWDWAKTQKQRPTKNMKYEVKKGIYEYWK
jgi:UDP-glucose 4-epimerase